MNAALYNGVDHASRHCVGLRDHDAAKSNVHNTLPNSMCIVNECDKISGRGPLLLGGVIGVIKEPIPCSCRVRK